MKTLPAWFETRMNKDIDDLAQEWKTTFDEAENKILKVAYLKGYKAAKGL